MAVKKTDLQALWLPAAMVREAKALLAGAEGTYYVRVCAAGNIIAGEMAVSRLELIPNRLVYKAGAPMFTEKLSVLADGRNINQPAHFLGVVKRRRSRAASCPTP
jgi:hypothetical protein